jgi:Uma2 family endonuclease
MSTAVKIRPQPAAPAVVPPFPRPLYRFTVEQYERMTELGILTANDRVELLERLVVQKMTQHPPHAVAVDCTDAVLRALLPAPWYLRDQKPIRLSDSEPEPDLAVVQGPPRRYQKRHPTPPDLALVIEVADTSLVEDRERKGPLYARARLPVYWIINLVERQVEVYTQPKGGKAPAYRQRRDYREGEAVPLTIAGQEVGQVPVRDLLP